MVETDHRMVACILGGTCSARHTSATPHRGRGRCTVVGLDGNRWHAIAHSPTGPITRQIPFAFSFLKNLRCAQSGKNILPWRHRWSLHPCSKWVNQATGRRACWLQFDLILERLDMLPPRDGSSPCNNIPNPIHLKLVTAGICSKLSR